MVGSKEKEDEEVEEEEKEENEEGEEEQVEKRFMLKKKKKKAEKEEKGKEECNLKFPFIFHIERRIQVEKQDLNMLLSDRQVCSLRLQGRRGSGSGTWPRGVSAH